MHSRIGRELRRAQTAQHVGPIILDRLWFVVRVKTVTSFRVEHQARRSKAYSHVHEPQTVAWFALRSGPSSFAIVDAFPDDDGRQQHLNGQVAAALLARSDELLAAPLEIGEVDILAAKLP